MAMQYINYIAAKARLSTATRSQEPVLSEEDELFLNRITSDENPPALPPRPQKMDESVVANIKSNDAQTALLDGAQYIPLPETPQEMTEEPFGVPHAETSSTETTPKKSRPTWNWMRRDSRDAKRQATAAGLEDIAQGLKNADATPNEDQVVTDVEAKKEEEDMTVMLEKLNLAAVNNRVFSISDETQQLLQQFNLVFKDLINGVPTAYDDLEKLLTNGDRQLQKTFNSLPGFLQKLIERLPETMTKGLAPEIMAVAAERAQRSGMNMQNAGKAASAASRMLKTPSLKDLVGKPGAIAGMLRSIITYLRARFPAFLGMNVLWSLALFVLLFVFWYCYKRGKESRLEQERELTEQELQQLEKEYESGQVEETPTTTAEKGAPIEEVQAGIVEVQAAKMAEAEQEPKVEETEQQPVPSEASMTT